MAHSTAVAALQEAPFACFEVEENDALTLGTHHAFGAALSSRGMPTHVVAMPGSKALPARSVARVVRSLECTGSGSFYFQNEAMKHRFICWRITKNVMVLREWSLHTSLEGNALRLQFPAAVVPSGVAAFESWDASSVVISVLTHAASIHRVAFPIPQGTTKKGPSKASVFKQTEDAAKAPSIFPHSPKFRTATDIVHSLQTNEAITTALWVNEYNLIVATDGGRIIGVNFGLPSAPEYTPQEFLFTDESMMQWLWKGLVKSNGQRKRTGGSDEISAESIVAMSFFPFDSDALHDEQEDEGAATEVDDVCILTLSADFTLRAWSFRNQTCLGKQSIRSHVRSTNPDDDDDGDDAGDDELEDASNVFATQAKMVAIPSTTSGACRILIHVDSTEDYPQQIVLLRGEIGRASTAATQLGLDVARLFTIGSNDKQRLKFVDFAVERGYLYSAWRSPIGDFVYSHLNPMALTGPRVIAGHLVSSVDVQMKKYDREDRELPFQLSEDEVCRRLIDMFYVERVLLPGRFSRQSLYKAISEYQGGLETPIRAYFTQAGPQESRYKEMLVGVVSSRAAAFGGGVNSNVQRVAVWKNLLDLCTKHWRSEVAPIGFACITPPTTDQLLGSPVLLRRNRVSLFFPSASSIAAAMLSKSNGSSKSSPSKNATLDGIAELLPAFDAFPSQGFQASVQNGVTSVLTGEDWQVESLLGLARQAVRSTMQSHLPGAIALELQLTRAILRLSQALGQGQSSHLDILQDLVERLSPANLASGESGDDPFTVNSDNEDAVDEDVAMNGDEGSSVPRPTQFFNAIETSYAFSQATARTVDELCTQSLRVVLCLAHLIDAQPSFIETSTLKAIERTLLPKAIVVYQRWSQSRWLANQNITSTSEVDFLSVKTSGTVLPPLLQFFLSEANESLNQVTTFQRARAVADMREFDVSGTEDPHQLIGSFASGILELMSRPNDLLVGFLQKKREFSILRSMLSCSLNDLSLQQDASLGPLKALIRVKYIRGIGECLAWEGHQAAKNEKPTATDYFKQAIRCFNMCLSSYVAQIETTSDGVGEDDYNRAVDTCERFIDSAVRLLKETIPRGYYQLILSFLWVIASEALELIESKKLKSFVWVNIFKYSVEERAYQDAHLALMRTVQLSSIAPGFNGTRSLDAQQDGSEAGDDEDIARTAVECTSYVVKELCRRGRLDLVCDFQWSALESEVEHQIQWLAANANVVVTKEGSASGVSVGGIDPAAVMHHQLVYAYYARRQQPANAASAMYALYLRLSLATANTKLTTSLRTQRNALLAAMNVLLQLENEENRWIVRKLHTEELAKHKDSMTALNIVTYQDMERDLAVLNGKLRLVEAGHEQSVLLGTMNASAVVALLVDAALRSAASTATANAQTLSEKKQQSLVSLEIAVQIAAKNSLGYDHVTKSIARFCVANVHSIGTESLAWELLKTYLRFVDQLLQYEIAALEILTWQVKIVLPEWITLRMSCPKTGNPSKLVLLYLTHGLLIEASTAAAAMVPVDLLREGEAAFRKRSNAASASLPWLPYNLFDSVLAAADHALTGAINSPTVGGGVNGSFSGDPALRAAVQTLRSRLTEYFKYVNNLEQARRAASVARESYDAL